MPRKKKPWFRVYVEMVRDRKLRRLTPAQRWLWVVMMACARESPIPGLLMLSETEAMTAKDLAGEADVKLTEVTDAITKMEGPLEMLERDERFGAWFIPSFWERQYESDTRSHHGPAGDEMEGVPQA